MAKKKQVGKAGAARNAGAGAANGVMAGADAGMGAVAGVGAGLWTAAKFVGRVAPLILIIGGVLYGSAVLWVQEYRSGKYVVGATPQSLDRFKGVDVPLAAKRDIMALEARAKGINLLDPDAPQKLRERFKESPWIGDTYSFRRDFARRQLLADFVVREPVAQVRIGKIFRAVDAAGVALPGDDTQASHEGLPIISCPVAEATNANGIVGSEELAHGLAVLRAIRTSAAASRIDVYEIEVKRGTYLDRALEKRVTRPIVEVVTGTGGRVRWGVCSVDSAFDEVSNAEKSKLLADLANRSLLPSGGQVVDIRTRNVYVSKVP